MFFAYLKAEEAKESEADRKILEAAGRMEFGIEWSLEKLADLQDDPWFAGEDVGGGAGSDKTVVKLDEEGDLKYNKVTGSNL